MGVENKTASVKSQPKTFGCTSNHFPDLWNKRAEYSQPFSCIFLPDLRAFSGP